MNMNRARERNEFLDPVIHLGVLEGEKKAERVVQAEVGGHV